MVGTSAGSMIGALCASGVPPWFMVAHSRGEVFEGVVDADGRPAAEADRAGGARFRAGAGPAADRPRLLAAGAPHARQPAPLHARHGRSRGWIPRGIFSTESLRDTIRRVVPSGWSPHPNLWVVACDYETGRRVPFGRAGAPAGRPRRRGRRLLRDPGHLPPGDDRRAPLRRRRHLLDLEPRPAPRRGARPGDLPQPDLHPAPDPGPQPSRVARTWRCEHASGRRLGSEAKKLRAARHRGRPDPADQRGPRGDGSQPDEPPAAKPGDRGRPPHRRASSSTSPGTASSWPTFPRATRASSAAPTARRRSGRASKSSSRAPPRANE